MLKCIECGGAIQTTNTYNDEEYNLIVRRRKCKVCGKVFSTVERVEEVNKVAQIENEME